MSGEAQKYTAIVNECDQSSLDVHVALHNAGLAIKTLWGELSAERAKSARMEIDVKGMRERLMAYEKAGGGLGPVDMEPGLK